MRYEPLLAGLAVVAALAAAPAAADKGGVDLHGSYDVVAGWLKPIAPDFLMSPVTVFAETPDRIYIGSLGLTPKATAPPTLTVFNPRVPGAKPAAEALFVVNGQGEVIERWSQWYDRFPSIHKVTIDPYDPEKHVWVVDRQAQQVLKFTHDAKTLVMEVGERGVTGEDDKHFNEPSDIAFLPDGTFFVSDGYRNHRVAKFDKNGKFLLAWGTDGTGPSQFKLVHSVAVDAKRRVHVADRTNSRIQIFDENGTYLDQWPGMVTPVRILITQDQFAWVSDMGANKFGKFDLNGQLLETFGTWGKFPGGMNSPHDSSVDSEGNLYVTNSWNFTVDKYVPRKGADPKRLIGPRFRQP